MGRIDRKGIRTANVRGHFILVFGKNFVPARTNQQHVRYRWRNSKCVAVKQKRSFVLARFLETGGNADSMRELLAFLDNRDERRLIVRLCACGRGSEKTNQERDGRTRPNGWVVCSGLHQALLLILSTCPDPRLHSHRL